MECFLLANLDAICFFFLECKKIECFWSIYLAITTDSESLGWNKLILQVLQLNWVARLVSWWVCWLVLMCYKMFKTDVEFLVFDSIGFFSLLKLISFMMKNSLCFFYTSELNDFDFKTKLIFVSRFFIIICCKFLNGVTFIDLACLVEVILYRELIKLFFRVMTLDVIFEWVGMRWKAERLDILRGLTS